MSQGYLLKRLLRFDEDFEELFSYLAGFDDAVAHKRYRRFEEALLEIVNDAPYRYPYFRETGAPSRAKLFRVGRRTFWIIYTIEGDVITMRRFWDSARRPGDAWASMSGTSRERPRWRTLGLAGENFALTGTEVDELGRAQARRRLRSALPVFADRIYGVAAPARRRKTLSIFDNGDFFLNGTSCCRF